jgi:hypothetical protein
VAKANESCASLATASGVNPSAFAISAARADMPKRSIPKVTPLSPTQRDQPKVSMDMRAVTWAWSWEDSNLRPSSYCQEMGEAQCNHSANIDHRLTKKLAAISVGETVGPRSCGSAKYWSEWQDLNLRPPRPEQGALPQHP